MKKSHREHHTRDHWCQHQCTLQSTRQFTKKMLTIIVQGNTPIIQRYSWCQEGTHQTNFGRDREKIPPIGHPKFILKLWKSTANNSPLTGEECQGNILHTDITIEHRFLTNQISANVSKIGKETILRQTASQNSF